MDDYCQEATSETSNGNTRTFPHLRKGILKRMRNCFLGLYYAEPHADTVE